MMHEADDEPIAISALNQFVFCARRCALMHVEKIWADNAHTAKGTLVHEHADFAGYEVTGKTKALRRLPLHSRRLGITGVADIVEVTNGIYAPVEYKKGKRRKFDNDEVQLCAQALCLEEMFAIEVERGFVFHAQSKRRREVSFDERLRGETVKTIAAVRELLRAGIVPHAQLMPRCDGCSLRSFCLPELFAAMRDDEQSIARNLWGD